MACQENGNTMETAALQMYLFRVLRLPADSQNPLRSVFHRGSERFPVGLSFSDPQWNVPDTKLFGPAFPCCFAFPPLVSAS